MNKTNLILTLSLIAILAISGCATTTYTDDGNTVVTEQTGKDIKQTITTDQGTVTTEGTVGKTGWCAEGTDWKWNSDANQAMGTGTMKIDKIMTSGKYSGLCHVIYTFSAEGQSGKWDYYFSEDGKSGYFVMDVNGQKIEQQWNG